MAKDLILSQISNRWIFNVQIQLHSHLRRDLKVAPMIRMRMPQHLPKLQQVETVRRSTRALESLLERSLAQVLKMPPIELSSRN